MKDLTKTFNMIIDKNENKPDFGFDSLYFRYAELCDELATCKAKLNGTDLVNEMLAMTDRKQHFYKILEQLIYDPEK